jgi:hypothetical protein
MADAPADQPAWQCRDNLALKFPLAPSIRSAPSSCEAIWVPFEVDPEEEAERFAARRTITELRRQLSALRRYDVNHYQLVVTDSKNNEDNGNDYDGGGSKSYRSFFRTYPDRCLGYASARSANRDRIFSNTHPPR